MRQQETPAEIPNRFNSDELISTMIPPAWFKELGFIWEELPTNARIAAGWVHAGARVFPCYSNVFEDKRGNIRKCLHFIHSSERCIEAGSFLASRFPWFR